MLVHVWYCYHGADFSVYCIQLCVVSTSFILNTRILVGETQSAFVQIDFPKCFIAHSELVLPLSQSVDRMPRCVIGKHLSVPLLPKMHFYNIRYKLIQFPWEPCVRFGHWPFLYISHLCRIKKNMVCPSKVGTTYFCIKVKIKAIRSLHWCTFKYEKRLLLRCIHQNVFVKKDGQNNIPLIV